MELEQSQDKLPEIELEGGVESGKQAVVESCWSVIGVAGVVGGGWRPLFRFSLTLYGWQGLWRLLLWWSKKTITWSLLTMKCKTNGFLFLLTLTRTVSCLLESHTSLLSDTITS